MRSKIRLGGCLILGAMGAGTCRFGRGLSLEVPLRCNGAGRVSIGDGASIGFALAPRAGNGAVMLQARTLEAVIEIGPNVSFSNNVSLIAQERITIGRDCLIGDFVLIIDSDFHGIDPRYRRTSTGATKPVSIGDNVWLGSRVVVQKGVSIGSDSIVTPQSVVTHDIPAGCIAGGNPARVIRTLPEDAEKRQSRV